MAIKLMSVCGSDVGKGVLANKQAKGEDECPRWRVAAWLWFGLLAVPVISGAVESWEYFAKHGMETFAHGKWVICLAVCLWPLFLMLLVLSHRLFARWLFCGYNVLIGGIAFLSYQYGNAVGHITAAILIGIAFITWRLTESGMRGLKRKRFT